ncbi:hypothetical protein [Hymenobacter convexus]|uniref:hypothetical protein n=1 Tax=Hymenobacter sp. CA1UV-4 TaxID=3063782 RepID=UPI002713BDAA|nr:hypothetical protein [Hymenobacter sp. CA1UV-4]MDO7852956.1 hypothetical protein [Hymenobacter sp. CA1UV-4]
MLHTTHQLIGEFACQLPPDFDLNNWIEQRADSRANQKLEALLLQQEQERERAVRRSSSEMAERYGVSLKRIQEWARNGILKAERPTGGFGHWSYLTGPCDDAVNRLRRPDGTIKGSWRGVGHTNKKARSDPHHKKAGAAEANPDQPLTL